MLNAYELRRQTGIYASAYASNGTVTLLSSNTGALGASGDGVDMGSLTNLYMLTTTGSSTITVNYSTTQTDAIVGCRIICVKLAK